MKKLVTITQRDLPQKNYRFWKILPSTGLFVHLLRPFLAWSWFNRLNTRQIITLCLGSFGKFCLSMDRFNSNNSFTPPTHDLQVSNNKNKKCAHFQRVGSLCKVLEFPELRIKNCGKLKLNDEKK